MGKHISANLDKRGQVIALFNTFSSSLPEFSLSSREMLCSNNTTWHTAYCVNHLAYMVSFSSYGPLIVSNTVANIEPPKPPVLNCEQLLSIFK